MKMFKSTIFIFSIFALMVSAKDEVASAVSLTEKSFDTEIGKMAHFVMFFAPWCGHCKRLAPTWKQLAGNLKTDFSNIVVAKVDCTSEANLCSRHGVNGYPTLKMFHSGKIYDYNGGRTLKEMKDYAVSILGTKARKTTMEPSKVYMLDDKTFDASIESDLTFVQFFTERCEHCERLADRWEELAVKYAPTKDVKIAKFNCTSKGSTNNLFCDEEGVNSFPTLVIYKDGRKISKYNGKQSLKALDEFIKAWRQQHTESKTSEL